MSPTRQAERKTRPTSLSWSAATQRAAWRFFAWLFATGFVANPSGTLALHGPADAVRLVLLTALAGLAAYLTGPRHRLDSWRGRW